MGGNKAVAVLLEDEIELVVDVVVVVVVVVVLAVSESAMESLLVMALLVACFRLLPTWKLENETTSTGSSTTGRKDVGVILMVQLL